MIIKISSFLGAVHFPLETISTFNCRLEPSFNQGESLQTLAQAVRFWSFVIVVGFFFSLMRSNQFISQVGESIKPWVIKLTNFGLLCDAIPLFKIITPGGLFCQNACRIATEQRLYMRVNFQCLPFQLLKYCLGHFSLRSCPVIVLYQGIMRSFLVACSGCFHLFVLQESSKHKRLSRESYCNIYCLIFYYDSELDCLFVFRSGGDSPDIYKGKICSLKARVRQSIKVIHFTLQICVQLCRSFHKVLIIPYVFKYYFKQ